MQENAMPSRAGFGPEALTALTKVYNGVVYTFGLAEPTAKERAAKIVLSLATELGTLRPEELRAEAIAKLKLEGFRSAQ